MARSTVQDARLVCRVCGQSWSEVEQACACETPLSKCCRSPLHREWWTPRPTSSTFIYIFYTLLGFLLGASIVNYGAAASLTRWHWIP